MFPTDPALEYNALDHCVLLIELALLLRAERTRATIELEAAIKASDDACQAFHNELVR